MTFLTGISDFLNSFPQWLSSVITAMIGAFVGGWFTLKGVDREAKITRAETEKTAIELKLSVLKGIKGEISTFMNLYDKRIKDHIDSIAPGKMLNIIFFIGDDNFTFYEQNAKIIAKLDDAARDSIINVYTYARSLIESFRLNNQRVKDCEKILFDMADNNKNQSMYERLYADKSEEMVDYAQAIKSVDAELRDAINEGFEVINREIAELQVKLKDLYL